MLFKNAKGEVKYMDASSAAAVILVGSNNAESILSQFSAVEMGDMIRWARAEASTGNAVNLARWPGWQSACARMNLDAGRAREVASALLARLTAAGTL